MAMASLLALFLCSAVVVDALRQSTEEDGRSLLPEPCSVLATVTDAAGSAVGGAAWASPGTVRELQQSILAETGARYALAEPGGAVLAPERHLCDVASGKTEIALTAFLDIGAPAEGDLEPNAARDQAPPASGAAKKTVSFNPKVTIIGDDGVETTEAEEDTCRPEGVGLRVRCAEMPMWTDVIELMGAGRGPRMPYKPYGPCLEANESTPYLHHNGIRKCCMPSPPTKEMACNLLSAVNRGVQTTKLSKHALAMMMDDEKEGLSAEATMMDEKEGLSAKARGWLEQYGNYVQIHKDTIDFYKRNWERACPPGTFAEVAALDTKKDIENDAKREQLRALVNGCLDPSSMVKKLKSLMRSSRT